jgi:hypothetical protein
MLPRSELPPEYTTPQWWCPSKVSGAAVIRAEMTTRAKMRIVYEVLGGSLPFGFMNELQVSLVSLTHSESVEEGQTAESETAVVERICGTVLSEAYDCGGGEIREWIVISRPPMLHAEFDQASGVMRKPATDCICIMGWIDLYSMGGTTDWRLFTRVMREIESREKRALALCLRKKTFCVDSHGKMSNALEIPRQQLLYLRITFEEGGQKRQDRAKRERVLPSSSWKEYTLVQAQDFDRPCLSEGSGQLKRRGEKDMIRKSTGSEAVVLGGARQRRSVSDENSARLGPKDLDEGLCEKELAYSRLTAFFSDNRLSSDVCEKACSLFNVKCIEDLSYLEDRDIGKLELSLVNCRKLEKLVREVRSQSVQKPAKEALPHAKMPGNVDAEIPRFALTVGIHSYTRGMVAQVRDPGMVDITDRYALLIGNSDYQGRCDMVYRGVQRMQRIWRVN